MPKIEHHDDQRSWAVPEIGDLLGRHRETERSVESQRFLEPVGGFEIDVRTAACSTVVNRFFYEPPAEAEPSLRRVDEYPAKLSRFIVAQGYGCAGDEPSTTMGEPYTAARFILQHKLRDGLRHVCLEAQTVTSERLVSAAVQRNEIAQVTAAKFVTNNNVTRHEVIVRSRR